MKYKVLTPLRCNGKQYKVGDTIELDNQLNLIIGTHIECIKPKDRVEEPKKEVKKESKNDGKK